MRYLLDTNVLLFLFAQPARVKKSVRDTLADPTSELYVSAASAWEIAIKVAIGKLSLPGDSRSYVVRRMQALRMQSLSITLDHAFAMRSLPAHHNDPFDRLLVAQAQIESMTIVTKDRLIMQYAVPTLIA
jgi:PIN domain nuclease of toxin-antitoxin system